MVAIKSQTIKVACSDCNLRELCMPMGVTRDALTRVDSLVATRRKVKRRETLFRMRRVRILDLNALRRMINPAV